MRRAWFHILTVWFLALTSLLAEDSPPSHGRVHALKVTILSTMLADGEALGEWGFAALVEVDGHRLLFDTGAHSDVVLLNARSLSINLANVPEVVISHSHSDHVGGFLTLRREIMKVAPTALARTYVGEGIFYPRVSALGGVDDNPMTFAKPAYEKMGGEFISYDKPVQLYPGVWLTGPVPRKFPERSWSGAGKMKTPQGIVEDNLPEDMALIFDTDQGLVVLTGCGHAGVVNIVHYARSFIGPSRIHALIGGLHLFAANEQTLTWTADRLREVGVDNLLGAHCTGIETVFRFRKELNLDRAHAVVGAVGASFELGKGINPGNIAR